MRNQSIMVIYSQTETTKLNSLKLKCIPNQTMKSLLIALMTVLAISLTSTIVYADHSEASTQYTFSLGERVEVDVQMTHLEDGRYVIIYNEPLDQLTLNGYVEGDSSQPGWSHDFGHSNLENPLITSTLGKLVYLPADFPFKGEGYVFDPTFRMVYGDCVDLKLFHDADDVRNYTITRVCLPA